MGGNILNHILNQGLLLRTYKALIQLNSKKINKLIKKWAKDLNGYFRQKCRYMKRCATSQSSGKCK
jgi:hypothetical protein